ncbi:MAG: hypothetical protein LBP89_00480 [Helicobacteraceae bacterium]|jgi:hypothetical protein|nr:hypothetical protein [Helicobacteraceae bacterium]
MEAKFVAIVERLVKEQGKDTLIDAKKCKAHLADYANNEFKKERHLLLIAIEVGAGKAIATTNELDICKKQQIRLLKEDHFIDEIAAAKAVDLLALALRGDTSKSIALTPNANSSQSNAQQYAPSSNHSQSPRPSSQSKSPQSKPAPSYTPPPQPPQSTPKQQSNLPSQPPRSIKDKMKILGEIVAGLIGLLIIGGVGGVIGNAVGGGTGALIGAVVAIAALPLIVALKNMNIVGLLISAFIGFPIVCAIVGAVIGGIIGGGTGAIVGAVIGFWLALSAFGSIKK